MEHGSPARGSVLVVDDEPTITEVVSRYLQRAGYDTRAIVEAHGGEIWFADSTAGARVRFSLPRAGYPRATEPRPHRHNRGAPSTRII